MCSSFHCGIIQILSNFALVFFAGLKLVFHFCLAVTLGLFEFIKLVLQFEIPNLIILFPLANLPVFECIKHIGF